ncbi:MAG: NAD-dependent epimerase/dehydratase family protein, partial [Bacteroidetes bacterium]|nr:NAD-dependent epimerase/dehydratase family protein [Bacteroidota bacterium]
MKKVVVTGASGHIGFHVAKELLSRGYDTTILIRRENLNVFKLKKLGAKTHNCDLLNPESYANQLTHIDAVFHLA